MEFHKTYHFRLYPSEDQEALLSKHFGSVRFVYNYFLDSRQKNYSKNNKIESYNQQANNLVHLKKQEDTKWLNEVSAQSLQFSLRSLDIAYQRFFSKQSDFPRFKSKKGKNTFTISQYMKIVKDKIVLPKFKEGIKFKQHVEVAGKVCRMTISKTSTNKYFVSILTEQEIQPLPKVDTWVGIDFGIKEFIVTSENVRYPNYRYTKKYSVKLKIAQRHLSRKVKGSGEYEKQRLKVARIHEKIKNSRLDNLHKVSKQLINDNQVIAAETLKVKEMMKNRTLSKHISDASWGKFIELLTYKSKWYSRTLVKVDKYFPSSKTCNDCGSIKKDMKLSDREWVCQSCGSVHDRDLNASLNILKEGTRILSFSSINNTSVGTIDNTGGENFSMKPAVHLEHVHKLNKHKLNNAVS